MSAKDVVSNGLLPDFGANAIVGILVFVFVLFIAARHSLVKYVRFMGGQT